jgi:hypothetical protein
MTHLSSFIKKESHESDNGFEYSINDIDHPNGWNWKELDMLFNMNFEPQGDTRLSFTDKTQTHNTDDTPKKQLKVTIYKNKDGYWLIVNDRKHVFKTFINMMDFIDKMGSLPI